MMCRDQGAARCPPASVSNATSAMRGSWSALNRRARFSTSSPSSPRRGYLAALGALDESRPSASRRVARSSRPARSLPATRGRQCRAGERDPGQARRSLGPRWALVCRPMRRWVPAGGATALIAMPAVLAFFSGGYFDEARIVAAVIAWVLVIAARSWCRGRCLSPPPAGSRSLGLALLCAWTVLSIAWAPLGGQAQDDFNATALLGFFAAALALMRGTGTGAGSSRARARRIRAGRLRAVGAAAARARGARAERLGRRTARAAVHVLERGRDLGRARLRARGTGGRRPGPPRGRCARRWLRRRATRAGLYLSFARGALAALAVGMLVLVRSRPKRAPSCAASVVLVIASALAALVANGSSHRQVARRARRRRRPCDAGGAPVSRGRRGGASSRDAATPDASSRRVPARARPWRVAATSWRRRGPRRCRIEGKPEGTSPATGANPARLGLDRHEPLPLLGGRARHIRRASLAGIGSGGLRGRVAAGFPTGWTLPGTPTRSISRPRRSWVSGLAIPAVVSRRGRRRSRGPSLSARSGAQRPGPIAALAAWALHAGLDWDWEMPAVSLSSRCSSQRPLIAWSEELPAPG